MSAMCAGWTPTNNLSTKRHAAATRGEDNAEWTTVLSNKETTKKTTRKAMDRQKID